MAEHPRLTEGDRGEWVTYLQQHLAQHGHAVSADGHFGHSTRDAVIAFQQGANLHADGVVGGRTWAALGAEEAESAASESEAEATGETHPALEFSVEPFAQDARTITYAATNRGDGVLAAAGRFDSITITPDGDHSRQHVEHRPIPGDLQPGAGYTAQIRIPDEFGDGKYWLALIVDAHADYEALPEHLRWLKHGWQGALQITDGAEPVLEAN